MSEGGVRVRDATREDVGQLAALHRRARAAAMPWLPDLHDEASTRSWMENVVLAGQRVRVAVDGPHLCGFAALDGAWLEQLYVDPDRQRQGVGRALLDDAKRARPDGLSLHVFTRNARARRFYEAAGFGLVEQGDGRANEEREPDCTYVWRPPST